MKMHDWVAGLLPKLSAPLPVFGIAASATLASCLYLSSSHNEIIESPLANILKLSPDEQELLPFPPNVLPGARTVDSPYGSIRVYEWGPEDGRRVLFIHGLSTPGIALATLAEGLVGHGCRVMLFDLFGRGFSSTPNPAECPQDMKLFTTQILLALASSPVPWTGQGGFGLVGYSLGGGIAATFTSYFPNLVDSLILIAPAGLLRTNNIHWTSNLLYSGFLPSSLVFWLVWRRLGGNNKTPEKDDGTECGSHPAMARDSRAPLYPRRPSVSVSDAVAWQLQNHTGFLPAFISSTRFAPISSQHEHWRRIGSRLSVQRLHPSDENDRQGLREGKILLIAGKTDDVVPADHLIEDAIDVMGEESLDVRVFDGGHDLPVVAAQDITEAIVNFWDSSSCVDRSQEFEFVAR